MATPRTRSSRPDPSLAPLALGSTAPPEDDHLDSDPWRYSEDGGLADVVAFCASGMRAEAQEAEAAAARHDAMALEGALDRSRWLLTLLGRAVRHAQGAPGGPAVDVAAGCLVCLMEFARLTDAADGLQRSATPEPS